MKIDACGKGGTGVLVSPDRVITALHVVLGCTVYSIELPDGTMRVGEMEIAYRRDIARVILAEPVEGLPRPALATAVAGSDTCFTTGEPERRVECGRVSGINWGWWRGEIDISHRVVKGNSGSPMWDAKGRLIGIVVTCDIFPDTSICLPFGGGASGFSGARWLVEDVDMR